MPSSGGHKTYVVGYWYLADILFALCHSMSKLKAIKVGDKIAWTGDASAGRISINKPNLFGGESSEGGIVAEIDLMDGNPDQEISTYLTTRSKTDQPAYRGLVTALIRNGKIAGMNPYLKSWDFLVEDDTVTWQPDLMLPQIDGTVTGMNPVHIIWDVLTSNGGAGEWGSHLDTSLIDEAAFLAAAQTLYNEGFGLAPTQDGGTSDDDFISDICDYIDGIVFEHPRTGLQTIKLFRGDYDIDTIPHFDESSISKVNSYSRKDPVDLYNKVLLTWTQVNEKDGEGETVRTLPLDNPAAQALQGKPIILDVDGKHITNGSVAQKVAERKILQNSYPFAATELIGNRNLSQLVRGDVFAWSNSDYGVVRVVMRVLEIDYGSLTDEQVTVTCSEDIYGLDYTMFDGPGAVEWTNPVALPEDAEFRSLVELPYHLLVNGVVSESDLASRDETSGIMATLIGRPSGTSLAYELYEYVSARAAWVCHGNQLFTPTGTISADIAPTTTSLSVEGITEPQRITPGVDCLAVIDNEWMWVKSGAIDADLETATLTIGRGVLDTVPAAHAEGARVWFVGVDDYGLCETVYLEGLTIRLKACPMTSRGVLSLDAASENTKTFAARAIRPYPPANVRINGMSFPTALADDSDITLTWDNRNRIDQTGALDDQTVGNILPEAGTTINIYVYDADTGGLIRSATGLATEPRSWTYPVATELADREERVGEALRVEVEAVRDGWESWQRFVVPVPARQMSTGCLVASTGDTLITNTGAKIAYQE